MNLIRRDAAAGRLARLALAIVSMTVLGSAAWTPAAAQVLPSDRSRDDALSANFELAARWAPYKTEDRIYSTIVRPQWIEGSEKFWYDWDTSDGTFFYIVDPVEATKRQIFDNDVIAAELTRITRDPWDARHLPIRNIRFIDENTLRFDVESSQEIVVEETDGRTAGQRQQVVADTSHTQETEQKVFHFEYNVTTQTLRELEEWEEPDDHPDWASVSPDGETVIFARNHNLYMMSGEDYRRIVEARRGKDGDEADEAGQAIDVTEVQLTEDGVRFYSYADTDRGMTDKERLEARDERKEANVVWSRDSRRFAMVRSDVREVDELWVIHAVGNDRPELETYKYAMPGEEDVGTQELLIYDLEERRMIEVQADAWEDQNISIATADQFYYPDSEEPRRSLWLSDDSDQLYFTRNSRGRKRVDLVVADATTGETRVIIEERLNTYIQTRDPVLLPNDDILWWSERDGWAHIYLYGNDGTLKNRLTEGPFSVRSIEAVDEEAGVVYFQATGRQESQDPYFAHFYRVNLDGSGLTLLNPGNFDHRVDMGESNRFFVDNYSRVNTVPTAVLRDRTGEVVLPLDTADFSRLKRAGWQMPEPFTVKAADDVTDLYGVMYKPFDFDPDKEYPIIAYVYPGPQTEAVSKSFSSDRYETGLAQFGFIVITVGNRGGHPARSKWYHNYGYGNLRDYGLADKKTAIEQLAIRHDYIDMDRVGIYGHSGGGFMSTAAMLVYPDFFKVAVSSSGNHENNIYNRGWSEMRHGVEEVVGDSGKVSFEYEIDKNSELAENLKGHLLLTTGGIDNNVHMANTLRMANALIKANKRFDFFIFPGQRHGYGDMGDYWFWLRAEYFVDHLLGDDRWSADIIELRMEEPQTAGR